mmetsp:Transcript_9799/g.23297  ORF Transcript_9799/g.23297 Transcript_9799/m.23297 type:complete len:574 (+) Transcript_9799:243-1964(+)
MLSNPDARLTHRVSGENLLDPDDDKKEGAMTIDEALNRIGLGRGQYFSITVMCLFWIADGMQMFIFFYLPKAVNEDWGTPADAIGWIDGSMFIGVAVGALLAGHFGDEYGRKIIILTSGAISSVGGVMCWWVTGFLPLLFLRFVVGIGVGGFGPASLSTTLETCPSKMRGKVAIAVGGFASAVGRVLVALLASALYDPAYNPNYSRFGWRVCLLICTIPGFLALILGLYVLAESPRWLLIKQRKEEASQALRNLALKNGKGDEFPEGTELVAVEDDLLVSTDSTWQRLSVEPYWSALVVASLSHCFMAFAYFGMIFVLPIYIDTYGSLHGWSQGAKDITLVIVAASEIPAIFILMFTIELEHIGRRWSAIGSMAGCSLFCMIFNFHVISELFHSSYGVLVPSFFARGFAAAGLIIGGVYVGEIFPTHVRVGGLAVCSAFSRFGSAFAPVISGFLIVDFHPSDWGMWTKLQPLRVFVLFSALSGLAAYLIWELAMEPAGRHLPSNEEETMEQVDEDREVGGNLNEMTRMISPMAQSNSGKGLNRSLSREAMEKAGSSPVTKPAAERGSYTYETK